MPKNSPLLSLKRLRVSVEGKEVVKGIDLMIREGEIHALMGPNGSGKSTLVHALMGHPSYEMKGEVKFLGKDLCQLSPDARAARGLFLAFQYPRELAGVSLRSFLFASQSALAAADKSRKRLSLPAFSAVLEAKMKDLKMDPSFAERSLNQGFSGGEKKKAEMLQMAMLSPRLALLDETDSGLDIDALQIVGEEVESLRSPKFSALIVTHYARLLEVITPDHVHVMVRGKIVESGGKELAQKLEREGYARYGVTDEGNILLG